MRLIKINDTDWSPVGAPSFLSALKGLSSDRERREALEALALDERFAQELLQDDGDVGGLVSVLLTARANLPTFYVESLLEDHDRVLRFMNLAAEAGYNPADERLIASMTEVGCRGGVSELSLVRFLERVPSRLLPVESVVRLINTGAKHAALAAVERDQRLVTVPILAALSRAGAPAERVAILMARAVGGLSSTRSGWVGDLLRLTGEEAVLGAVEHHLQQKSMEEKFLAEALLPAMDRAAKASDVATAVYLLSRPDFFKDAQGFKDLPAARGLHTRYLQTLRGDTLAAAVLMISPESLERLADVLIEERWSDYLRRLPYASAFEREAFEPLFRRSFMAYRSPQSRSPGFKVDLRSVPRESRHFDQALRALSAASYGRLDWRLFKSEHATVADYARLFRETPSVHLVLSIIASAAAAADLETLREFAPSLKSSTETVSYKALHKILKDCGPGLRGELAAIILPHVSSQARAALKKSDTLRGIILVKPEMPTKKGGRKQSYFYEVMAAIDANDRGSFRRHTDGSLGYYLMDVVSESSGVKTKRERALRTHMRGDFLTHLTIDEMELLKASKVQCRYAYDDDLPPPLARIQSLEDLRRMEALIDGSYGGAELLHRMADDEVFFLTHVLDQYFAQSLMRVVESKDPERIQRLLSAPEVFARLTASASLREDASSDDAMIAFFSSVLPAASMRVALGISDEYAKNVRYHLTALIGVKGWDGELVLRREDILRHISDDLLNNPREYFPKLMAADEVLAREIAAAFVAGGQELGPALFPGNPLRARGSLRRKSEALVFYKNCVRISSKGAVASRVLVDEIFARGGAIEDFIKEIPDLSLLSHWHEGREVIVSRASALSGRGETSTETTLDLMRRTSGVHIKIHTLHLESLDGTELRGLMEFAGRMTVLHVKLKGAFYDLLQRLQDPSGDIKDDIREEIDSLKEFLRVFGLALHVDAPLPVLSLLKRRGVPVDEASMTRAFGLVADGGFVQAVTSGEDLKFLEDECGLTYGEMTVRGLIKAHYWERHLMRYLAGRLGDLSFVTIPDGDMSGLAARCPEEHRAMTEAGLMSVDGATLEMMDLKNRVVLEGVHFAEVDISDFTDKEKVSLIGHIERRVDPRYRSLNLSAMILTDVKRLLPFELMRREFDYSDEGLRETFALTAGFLSAPRLMSSLKDLLRVSPEVSSRAAALRGFMAAWFSGSSDDSLRQEDLLRVDGSKSVALSEEFKVYDRAVLAALTSGLLEHKAAAGLMTAGRGRGEALAFARRASSQDVSQARDLLEMLGSALASVAHLRERLSEDQSAEERRLLEETVAGYEARVAEVASMDHPAAIHDRLTTLLNAFKKDPVQSLNQAKFRPLERSGAAGDLGVNLWFPRTRGDLMTLGQKYGWCVGTHSSYGDNVIKRGNVLVALCDPAAEASAGSVVALAHFVRRGPGDYYLEQLKGPRNVDVSANYNHRLILRAILDVQKKSEEDVEAA